MSVSVCVVPASTGEVEIETVPDPSAALSTVTDGCAARSVRVPPLVDFCFVVQFVDPVAVGAVAAPFGLTDVSPYFTVTVAAAASVRFETVIVQGPLPATAIVPAVVVV